MPLSIGVLHFYTVSLVFLRVFMIVLYIFLHIYQFCGGKCFLLVPMLVSYSLHPPYILYGWQMGTPLHAPRPCGKETVQRNPLTSLSMCDFLFMCGWGGGGITGHCITIHTNVYICCYIPSLCPYMPNV